MNQMSRLPRWVENYLNSETPSVVIRDLMSRRWLTTCDWSCLGANRSTILLRFWEPHGPKDRTQPRQGWRGHQKKTSWSTQWRAGLPFRGVLTGWKNGPTKSSLCSPKQMPSPILGTDQPHADVHSGGYLSRKELWRKESGQPWWTTGLGWDSSVPPENGRAA